MSDWLFRLDTGYAFSQAAGQDTLVTGALAKKGHDAVLAKLSEIMGASFVLDSPGDGPPAGDNLDSADTEQKLLHPVESNRN